MSEFRYKPVAEIVEDIFFDPEFNYRNFKHINYNNFKEKIHSWPKIR